MLKFSQKSLLVLLATLVLVKPMLSIIGGITELSRPGFRKTLVLV